MESAAAQALSNIAQSLGNKLDTETGLYYFGARYLDPQGSRWVSCDPAMEKYLPAAPVSEEVRERNRNLPGMGGVFNPANLNLYHYAGNNPLKYHDPDGKVFAIALIPALPYIMAAAVATYATIKLAFDIQQLQEDMQTMHTEEAKNDKEKKIPKIVEKQPNPKNGPPDSTTRTVDKNGKPIQDREFGPDGKAKKDIDYTDHGNPNNHPEVPHEHKWDWTKTKPRE